MCHINWLPIGDAAPAVPSDERRGNDKTGTPAATNKSNRDSESRLRKAVFDLNLKAMIPKEALDLSEGRMCNGRILYMAVTQ